MPWRGLVWISAVWQCAGVPAGAYVLSVFSADSGIIAATAGYQTMGTIERGVDPHEPILHPLCSAVLAGALHAQRHDRMAKYPS